MKVFVINLDKDKDRMASINAQLRELGIPYERVSGVYAKEMPEEEINKTVNRFRWWCAIGRPVVPAEVGCALSHKKIYEMMSSDEAVCILEDDVVIEKSFHKNVKDIETVIDCSRPQVYLLSNHQERFSGKGIMRHSYGTCTDGYIITKPAADAIIRHNFPLQVPCDHWGRWVGQGLIELYHVLPACIRQDQERFGTSTQAEANLVSKLPPLRWFLHKSKRLLGKTIDETLVKLGL